MRTTGALILSVVVLGFACTGAEASGDGGSGTETGGGAAGTAGTAGGNGGAAASSGTEAAFLAHLAGGIEWVAGR